MLNKNKIRRYSADPALGSLKTRESTNLNQCVIMKRISLEILVFSKTKRGKRKTSVIKMTDFSKKAVIKMKSKAYIFHNNPFANKISVLDLVGFVSKIRDY